MRRHRGRKQPRVVKVPTTILEIADPPGKSEVGKVWSPPLRTIGAQRYGYWSQKAFGTRRVCQIRKGANPLFNAIDLNNNSNGKKRPAFSVSSYDAIKDTLKALPVSNSFFV